MAMTVMAIGAAAVISMQATSVKSNQDARMRDVANSIARTWVERLRRDAIAWTLPNPSNATSNIANTSYINAALGVSAGTWVLPIATPTTTVSYGFDVLGRDLDNTTTTPTANAPVFCANIRLQWLATNQLIRADVRVLWPRGISNSPGANWCFNLAGVNKPDPTLPPMYYSVYTTTTITENAAQ